MLKNHKPTYTPPRITDLDVEPNKEVNKILEFVDSNISSFPFYYQEVKDSEKENRITDCLINHFDLVKVENTNLEFPFRFSKNPTQEESDRETDIGIYIMTRTSEFKTVFEFEAKRFSESSNNKEYVCGDRGGIERFKRGLHCSHLKVCGMLGYIQSRSSIVWIEKVNKWINELSINNKDSSIDWTDKQELLVKIDSFPPYIEKLRSINYRIQKEKEDSIVIWHFFIDLTKKFY